MITNKINHKIYIGQTIKSLEERWAGHIQAARLGWKTHLYNAMRKYGVDNFEIHPIAEVYDIDTLNLLEDFFIHHYDSMKNGYNMMGGGRNNPMDYEKSRLSHDAKMRTPEVRNKISNTLKEYYRENHDSEAEVLHRKRLSEKKKALYASPEGEKVKEKFRKSFKFSPEHYYAINSAKYKPVYCINTDNKVLNSFKCVKDAAFWWYSVTKKYAHLNSAYQLYDYIKKSATKDIYIDSMKWVYGMPSDVVCGEASKS